MATSEEAAMDIEEAMEVDQSSADSTFDPSSVLASLSDKQPAAMDGAASTPQTGDGSDQLYHVTDTGQTFSMDQLGAYTDQMGVTAGQVGGDIDAEFRTDAEPIVGGDGTNMPLSESQQIHFEQQSTGYPGTVTDTAKLGDTDMSQTAATEAPLSESQQIMAHFEKEATGYTDTVTDTENLIADSQLGETDTEGTSSAVEAAPSVTPLADTMTDLGNVTTNTAEATIMPDTEASQVEEASPSCSAEPSDKQDLVISNVMSLSEPDSPVTGAPQACAPLNETDVASRIEDMAGIQAEESEVTSSAYP